MVSAKPEKREPLTTETHEQVTTYGRFSSRKDVHSRNLFWPRLPVSTSTTVKLPVRLVAVTDTSSARTITLGTELVKNGRVIEVIDESGAAGTNNITIATEASQTINGASTVTITHNYGSVVLVSDGSNWTVSFPRPEAHRFASYAFASPTGSSGIFYVAGFYEAPAADANLTQGSTTVTLGTANVSYAAHAFVVAKEAGSASGGSGAVEVEVSGTSITDGGTRTASDTEIVVADITGESANDYSETPKKWIGQITYTLKAASGSTQTTFSYDFNYGFAKYDDQGNTNFTITVFEVVGRGGASDSGFNIKLLYHSSTGWTYHASAFVPGGTVLANMNTDHNTETDLADGQFFAYKRDNLSQRTNGDSGEGYVVEITTGANKAVEQMDIHVGLR